MDALTKAVAAALAEAARFRREGALPTPLSKKVNSNPEFGKTKYKAKPKVTKVSLERNPCLFVKHMKR